MKDNKRQFRNYNSDGFMVFLVILLIGGLLLFSSQASEAAEPLKIVVLNVEPYAFLTEDQQMVGIAYEMIKRIAEETGLQYEIEILPLARILNYLETGRADVTMQIQYEEIERVAIRLKIPLAPLKSVILGASGTSYSSLEDLHGKVVARLRAGDHGEEFESDTEIEKYLITSYQSGLQMVATGRVDAIIGMEEGLLYNAKKQGFTRDIFGEPLVLNTRYGYMYFSKKTADEEIIQKLEEAAGRLKAQNVFEEILDSFISDF